MDRVDFPVELEKVKDRAQREDLRGVFSELDRAAERLESALIAARADLFGGVWTPDFLRVDP
jgi:hypothetical protein